MTCNHHAKDIPILMSQTKAKVWDKYGTVSIDVKYDMCSRRVITTYFVIRRLDQTPIHTSLSCALVESLVLRPPVKIL